MSAHRSVHRHLCVAFLVLAPLPPCPGAEIPADLDRREDAAKALEAAGLPAPEALERVAEMDRTEAAELAGSDLTQRGGDLPPEMAMGIALLAVLLIFLAA